MNYEEITKITAERINDYMNEAIKTDSRGVAEMFHNAAWGARSLWFELASQLEIELIKKNKYQSYELSREIERQKEEFMKVLDRERIPLLREGQENETI
ncbi:hypothetical protein CJP72_09235 [Citrobacter sp. NCU1]|uniref:hypothetical protein n=1 Tax=Citrobacter sp. NCU1 TaxID=2026683 RepID=UPI001390E6A3|nr:hypothetical protein [Citrobacter sp. NCU1]NDO80944.1 hypothetical protein [Citrobacter sp. NCU1]